MSGKRGNSGQRKLGDPIPFRNFPETEIMISAIAEKRGESVQEVMRRLLQRAASEELMLEFGTDTLLAMIRNAMREVVKPTEERLAKIAAKSAIASSTSMYVNLETIGQLSQGKVNVKDIYDKSRTKAVAYVKTPTEEV